MLEHATPNLILNQIQSPPPPVEIDGEPEYEISEILDSKVDNVVDTVMSFIWSVGKAMKALTKKPHGFSLPNLETPLRLSLTSMPLTQLNLDHGHPRLNFLFFYTWSLL